MTEDGQPSSVLSICKLLLRKRKLRHARRRVFHPRAAENVKGIRCGAADVVICRAHDKLRAGRALTELPNHEMIAKLRVVEQHIIPLKPRRVDRVVIISVVADRDIRRGDDVLDEAGGLVCIRKDRIWVRNIHHHFVLSGCFFITKFVSATPRRITSCLRTTWYPHNKFRLFEFFRGMMLLIATRRTHRKNISIP